jgi:hypothetical protein
MKTNGITDRMESLGGRARQRMTRTKMDRLDRDNDRLRSQIAVLRDDLHAERDELKEALKAMNHHGATASVKRRRRPRILRTAAIAVGAYVLGTRAGRERYDQLVERARSLRGSLVGEPADPEHHGWDGDARSGSRSVGTPARPGTTGTEPIR